MLERGTPNQGILAYSMGSDGAGGPLLMRASCGSRTPPTAEDIAGELLEVLVRVEAAQALHLSPVGRREICEVAAFHLQHNGCYRLRAYRLRSHFGGGGFPR